MKKTTVPTDVLWEILRIQNEYVCLLWDGDDCPFDQEFLDEARATFASDKSMERRSVLVTIRDSDLGIREVPEIFERFTDEVYARTGYHYSHIISSPEKVVKGVLDKGKITTEREYYLIVDLLSDTTYSDVSKEKIELLEKFVFEYEESQ